jgi:tetratricopeptide (TPR) repeat protein
MTARTAKLTREWGSFALALAATCISVFAFISTQRSSKLTNRLEADRLLGEAWDLLGGKPGTNEIAAYVKAPDQLELASRKIEAAKLLAPKYGKAYWVDASLAIARGHYDDAASLCKKAILYDPNAPGPYNRLGQLHIVLGRWREASEDYQAAIKRRPNDAVLHSNLCYALLQMHNLGDAGRECERAIALDKTFKQAYANLEVVQERQGDSSKAAATRAALRELSGEKEN